MPPSAKTKRAYRKKYNRDNADKLRSKQRENYARNVEHKKIKNRSYYLEHQEKIKAASHTHSSAYYARNEDRICSYKRDCYTLSEPKPILKDAYVKDLQSHLLGDTKTKAHLITTYKKQQPLVKKVTGKLVCTVAAKRLLNLALQVRKEHVGSLLKTTRTIQSMQIKGTEDFGEGCHTASSEPYFYDSAYMPMKRLCLANR